MRAAVLTAFGAPLELREVERPRLVTPQDVVVRIAGAGVCHTDLHLWSGEWRDVGGRPVRLPHILGHENAGWIAEAGESALATGLTPEDPVILHPLNSCGMCRSCRLGDDMMCVEGREPGIHSLNGGFAEYMRTTLRSVVRLPDGTDPTRLAPLADAGLTAWHAVKRTIPHVKPDTWVAVVGVGGLGQFAVQLLKACAPVRVVAVDMAPDRLAVAKSLGADEVIMAEAGRFSERLSEKVERVSAVMDLVGDEVSGKESIACLIRGGCYSLVGYGGCMAVETRQMIQKELTVVSSLAGTYVDLLEVVALHDAGQLEVRCGTYPLDVAASVLASLADGKLSDRAVLVHR